MHQQFNTAVQHTAVRERIITDKLTYLHGDHLGSASLATDGSGGKVSAMRYYPYGATRSGAMDTDRRYTGQRWEASLGLYDYGARYYDPALGRFIQADTVVPGAGNPQALNRYAYAVGNPLKYTDPSGHRACLNWDANGQCIAWENQNGEVIQASVWVYPYIRLSLGSAYQPQGEGTNDCGPTNLAMVINLLARRNGIYVHRRNCCAYPTAHPTC